MRPSLSYLVGTGLLVLAGVAVGSSLVTAVVAGESPEQWWVTGVAGLFVVASVPFWVLNHRRFRRGCGNPPPTATGRRPAGGA